MKKNLKKIKLIVLIMLVMILVIIMNSINHDYILIHSDHSANAIKIDGKMTIWNLSQRLRLNFKYGHACGYQTAIKMIDNHSPTSIIPFNVECEEYLRSTESINKDIRDYYLKLQNEPTHRIYNLIVPVKFDKDSVLDVLDDFKIDYVLLDGYLNQLPKVIISIEHVSKLSDTKDRAIWQIEKKENESKAFEMIENVISKIKDKYNVEEVGEISSPSSGFGSTIEHEKAVTIYFQEKNDLSNLNDYVKSMNGQIRDLTIPTKYWISVLLDESVSIDEVFKQFDFVEEIKIYPEK